MLLTNVQVDLRELEKRGSDIATVAGGVALARVK